MSANPTFRPGLRRDTPAAAAAVTYAAWQPDVQPKRPALRPAAQPDATDDVQDDAASPVAGTLPLADPFDTDAAA